MRGCFDEVCAPLTLARLFENMATRTALCADIFACVRFKYVYVYCFVMVEFRDVLA